MDRCVGGEYQSMQMPCRPYFPPEPPRQLQLAECRNFRIAPLCQLGCVLCGIGLEAEPVALANLLENFSEGTGQLGVTQFEGIVRFLRLARKHSEESEQGASSAGQSRPKLKLVPPPPCVGTSVTSSGLLGQPSPLC